METRPTSTASTVLAHSPHRGLARVCRTGCIHLSYGAVTLDFRRREEFEALVSAVRRQRGSEASGAVRVQYGIATLQFSEAQFLAFSELVFEAAQQLRELDVVRRLLCDPEPSDPQN